MYAAIIRRWPKKGLNRATAIYATVHRARSNIVDFKTRAARGDGATASEEASLISARGADVLIAKLDPLEMQEIRPFSGGGPASTADLSELSLRHIDAVLVKAIRG
jgi:hypothetical protein